MALINCPECSKEISDQAVNCPNCGFPLHKPESQAQESHQQEIICPEFPQNLSIGEQIVNWGGDAAFSGEFRAEDNVIRTITPGGVKLLMHKNGINIASSFYISIMEIHNSQIISTSFADTSELVKQNKSVIGRAVVGSLLMGPMGTIVGGMSGIGTKNVKNNSYLVINYWDRFTKQAQTILIRGKDQEIRAFVGRLNTERSKIQTEAQKNAIKTLSETDQKILEICKLQGFPEAISFYLKENNIDVLKDKKALESAQKYVQGLAKSFGVQVKSSGCFIATACYGDYNAIEVITLRHYRDEKLLTNSLGRQFVNIYYFFSPAIAKFISRSELLKKIVRNILLQPIVKAIISSSVAR